MGDYIIIYKWGPHYFTQKYDRNLWHGEKSNHFELIPNREVGPHQAADPGWTDACLCREIAAVFMRVAPLTVILIYIAAAAAPKTKSRARGGEGEGSGSPSLSPARPSPITSLVCSPLRCHASFYFSKTGCFSKLQPSKARCKSFCDEIDIDANFIEVS